MLTQVKKLEADIAVVRTVNKRLVERLVKTERLCWENAQYSRQDTLEIVGIPNSVDSVLEEKVHGVFIKTGVEIDKQDVQACHCLKENGRNLVKFLNKKDCLQILRVKNELHLQLVLLP